MYLPLNLKKELALFFPFYGKFDVIMVIVKKINKRGTLLLGQPKIVSSTHNFIICNLKGKVFKTPKIK